MLFAVVEIAQSLVSPLSRAVTIDPVPTAKRELLPSGMVAGVPLNELAFL